VIAPSKLGGLVAPELHCRESFLRVLREKALVREDVPDILLWATVTVAMDEHRALSDGREEFNTPSERVRVFLAPFLTRKGRRWAVPLKSLRLPDDDVSGGGAWWKFWR